MKLTFRYTLLVLVGVLFSMSSASRSINAQNSLAGTFRRTLTVLGAATVDIRTGSGNVTIRQGGSGTVEILGTVRVHRGRFRSGLEERLRRIEADPPIEQSGSTIRIGHRDDSDLMRNVSISYEIQVPANTSLHANTGSGMIRAESITGSIRGETGSGDITLSQINSNDVDVSAGSGTISVSGVIGALRIHTGSGRITAQGEQKGPWDLEAGSGTIDVRLPSEAGFELNAHTGSGDVYTDRSITVRGRIGGRARDLVGRVGNGGPALSVRTGSGRVRIE